MSPQLVDRIGSPSVDVRTEALQTVCALAYDVDPGVDVRPAIPALLDVFRTEPDWRLQISALRALEAIGDGGSMAALRRGVGTPMEPPSAACCSSSSSTTTGSTRCPRTPASSPWPGRSWTTTAGRPGKSAGPRLVADRDPPVRPGGTEGPGVGGRRARTVHGPGTDGLLPVEPGSSAPPLLVR